METLSDRTNAAQQRLADCAKRYAWDEVFEVLAEYPEFVNAARRADRPESTAGRYSPRRLRARRRAGRAPPRAAPYDFTAYQSWLDTD